MSSASLENISPHVLKRVHREVQELTASPPEGIKLAMQDDDVTNILATIEGPVSTPYERGVFQFKLVLSSDFPASPPKGMFLTKIFHPNVSKSGEICVDTLKRDWKPELGLAHVFTVVRCLMIVPNPESALNEEAGKLLLENYEDYARHARMMTEVHAQPARPAQLPAMSVDEDKEEDDGDVHQKHKRIADKKVSPKVNDKKRGLRRL